MVESRDFGNFSLLEKYRAAKDSFLTIFGASLLAVFSVARLPVEKSEIKWEISTVYSGDVIKCQYRTSICSRKSQGTCVLGQASW